MDAIIVEAVRTPSGRGKSAGAYATTHPVDLLAQTLEALVARTGIDPALVDDVIGGCVTQAGEQAMNITRQAVLAAGFPESVPATTVDRQCGSSQQAVHFAAQAVASGSQDVVIACGVESMSRAPMWSNWLGRDPYGERVGARYPAGLVPQGIAAELVAHTFGIDRADMDAYSARSHQRALSAVEQGAFIRELVPVTVAGADGQPRVITADETIRPNATEEALAGLQPAFRADPAADRFPHVQWSVTAGNSSPLTDGASAVLIASPRAVERYGLSARGRVHTLAVAGADPQLMLTAVVPAVRRVMARAGLAVDDIDLFEINEAFACVPLQVQREVGIPDAKLNAFGGAIALGHPLGASGGRILATLLNGLERLHGRYGLQAMCEAGGMANAMIVERMR